jgi:hypothetical protein
LQKKKKSHKMNKKPPTKGDKSPTGGERNLHFSELPRRKHRKEGGEPFDKIKEIEEMKQKGKIKIKKKERGGGGGGGGGAR